MQDCEIVMRVVDEKLSIETKAISMEGLATLSGYLQTFLGVEACKRGMNIDDMKDHLLDMCLAAGYAAEEAIKKGNAE